ncbi:MAG: sigma-70 family RNA polymerase sigma factor [Deltaproteobacteria bacterium]|nr:sigma-70 family RNA polymerase sigma factor [Deltaproteobacteria bacterium]MBW2254128.1 sigma-70 family RNA polymerase sigma factor [Deltaproteobacteria bacterium]
MPRPPHSTEPSPRRVEGMTREELCAHYRSRVEIIARRVGPWRHNEVTKDDLVAYGMIGLLEAFDRYETERGIAFAAFADYRIRGAMLDALRSHDPFSRRRRDLAKRMGRATESIRQQQGREARPEEVADELGVSLDEYWHAHEEVQPVHEVSIHAPVFDDEDPAAPLLERIMDASDRAADSKFLARKVRHHLREAIWKLPEREREIVLLYYGRDMTCAEIGAACGVTLSRVSQILRVARGRLRHRLKAVVDSADVAAMEGIPKMTPAFVPRRVSGQQQVEPEPEQPPDPGRPDR